MITAICAISIVRGWVELEKEREQGDWYRGSRNIRKRVNGEEKGGNQLNKVD